MARRPIPLRCATALGILAGAAPAGAVGNEHVVDDAFVETPGTCHYESWATRFGRRAGLVYFGPGCTRVAWPNLELGGFVSHGRDGDARGTVIGIAPKFTLYSVADGHGVALDLALGYAPGQGRVETASAIVPVSFPAGPRLRVNLNGGAIWAGADRRLDGFVGGQAEYRLRPAIMLMAEVFGRTRQKAGGQFGVRWTSRGGDGTLDVDLVAGRFIDGVHRTALSIGLTLRR